MSALAAAVEKRRKLDEQITEMVGKARAAGETWAAIGEQLGVTTQAAHQRYRHLEAPGAKQARTRAAQR